MKRGIIAFLLVTALLISGCALKMPDMPGASSAESDNPALPANSGSFADEPRELTPSEVFFRIRTMNVTTATSWLDYEITNNTTLEFTYGEDFMLFRHEDSGWEYVDMNTGAGWNDIGIILVPGSVNNGSIDIGHFFGELDAGFYRIEKDIFSEEGEWLVTATEFTVLEEEK
ncbi:MAG: hypothetical protein LBC82_03710 [Oscillospiraceae bacterium]|nr:hypothetical protein [Oscillospiraceae bacterium]